MSSLLNACSLIFNLISHHWFDFFCRNNSYYLLIPHTVADKIYTLSSILNGLIINILWEGSQRLNGLPKVAGMVRNEAGFTPDLPLQSNCFSTECKWAQTYRNGKCRTQRLRFLTIIMGQTAQRRSGSCERWDFPRMSSKFTAHLYSWHKWKYIKISGLSTKKLGIWFMG